MRPCSGSLAASALSFAPGAGASGAALGTADSPFTDAPHRIADIIVPSQANQLGLNLPIDPNGVVYNSIARIPVAGATLTLLDGSGSPLPASCFDDPAQQGQVTPSDGYYKFDINFSDAGCPSGGDYVIEELDAVHRLLRDHHVDEIVAIESEAVDRLR